ncbi:hypothetical protein SESBI_42023 [Sesbania bispinosa]|nr:hypothetical protein SESBI_42023 [Sesbania bispinosa]
MSEKKVLLEDIADVQAKMKMELGKMVLKYPYNGFGLTRIVSQLAPQFYTKEDLNQIEELHKKFWQESSLHNNTTEETKSMNNNVKRCHETNEGKFEGGKRIKLIMMKKSTSPPPQPDLPDQFMNRIRELDGSDVRYVMYKKLSNTDVNVNNNRLSMTSKQIRCDLFTEREKAILCSTDEDNRPVGLEVVVLDPSLREFDITLKKWDMQSTSVYNLVKNWKLILSQNNLQVDHEFHIWYFRVSNKVYFILSNKDP